jgi:hypothetical protein
MSRARSSAMWMGGLLAATTACSKGTPASAATASGHVGAVHASTGNACDAKLLTVADVNGILADPVTGTKPIPGDPQSCEFTAGSSGLTVSLRPGLGRVTVGTWKRGKMPISSTPLPGVGDEAVWQGTLNEVIAEKNNLLCDIQLSGPPWGLKKGTTAEHQAAIGGLCNKIFAATP